MTSGLSGDNTKGEVIVTSTWVVEAPSFELAKRTARSLHELQSEIASVERQRPARSRLHRYGGSRSPVGACDRGPDDRLLDIRRDLLGTTDRSLDGSLGGFRGCGGIFCKRQFVVCTTVFRFGTRYTCFRLWVQSFVDLLSAFEVLCFLQCVEREVEAIGLGVRGVVHDRAADVGGEDVGDRLREARLRRAAKLARRFALLVCRLDRVGELDRGPARAASRVAVGSWRSRRA